MREINQLLVLLKRAEDDDTTAASELLSRLRAFREPLYLLSAPDLEPLLPTLLEELWQASCEAVYGDLRSVRDRRRLCEDLARQLTALHPLEF
jgi:hypothetical protein